MKKIISKIIGSILGVPYATKADILGNKSGGTRDGFGTDWRHPGGDMN